MRSKNPLHQLHPYLAQHRIRLNLAYLSALLSLILLILQNALLANLFAHWLKQSAQPTPNLIDPLTPLLPYLSACLLLRPWLNHYQTITLHTISQNIRSSLRQKLLQTLKHLGPERHQLGSDGSLSTQIIEQVDQLHPYLSRYHLQQKFALITPLIILILTYYHSPLAALLFLLTAPLVPLFMILVGKNARDKSQQQLQTLHLLSSHFLDLIRGMPTLKRLNATPYAQQTIAHSAEQYQQKTMGILRLAFLSTAVLELFASLSIALIAVYLGLGLLELLPWNKGHTPVPYQSALFILLLAPEFYAPLRELGSDYHSKAQAQTALENLAPWFNHHNSPTGKNAPHIRHSLHHPPSITLERLTLYSHDNRLRLPPTTLHIPANHRIAISGASGSGKSSLLQAILGYCPIHTGSLTLDQHPHQTLDHAHLRQQIAYLAQHPPLLPLTIAENLRLAHKTATDDQLHRALHAVQLQPLIQQLPHGIHTPLGEHGQGLSGGQQQRLAIAQLILQPKPLWLLDEPCAQLDPQTALELYQLIGQLSRHSTLILITHDEHHLLNTPQLNWLNQHIHLPTPNQS